MQFNFNQLIFTGHNHKPLITQESIFLQHIKMDSIRFLMDFLEFEKIFGILMSTIFLSVYFTIQVNLYIQFIDSL